MVMPYMRTIAALFCMFIVSIPSSWAECEDEVGSGAGRRGTTCGPSQCCSFAGFWPIFYRAETEVEGEQESEYGEEIDVHKCCTCVLASDYESKCYAETNSIVRYSYTPVKKRGDKCSDICDIYGRKSLPTGKVHKKCLAPEQSPLCKAVPWMHPESIYQCCSCVIGDEGPTTSTPTDSPDAGVNRCFVESTKGQSTCAYACSEFGYSKADDAATKIGHCGDGAREKFCVLLPPSKNDVFKTKSKGIFQSSDKFDVDRWIVTHAASAATLDEIHGVATKYSSQLGDDLNCDEVNEMSIHNDEHAAVYYANGHFSHFSTATSFAQKSVLYLSNALRAGHHFSAAHFFANVFNAFAVYSHALSFLHLPIAFASYVMVPVLDSIKGQMNRLDYLRLLLSSSQCIKHELSAFSRDKWQLKPALDNCKCGIESLIRNVANALIKVMEDLLDLSNCLSVTKTGAQAENEIGCLNLLVDSLFGVPDGLITQIALRLEIFCVRVNAMLLTPSDHLKTILGVVKLLPFSQREQIGNHTDLAMRTTPYLELSNAPEQPQPIPQPPLRRDSYLEAVSPSKSACGAFAYSMGIQVKLFEAFHRTIVQYRKNRAREHWSFPSINLVSDRGVVDNLVKLKPCKYVFSTDGKCAHSDRSFIYDNIPGMQDNGGCIFARRNGPMWRTAPAAKKSKKNPTKASFRKKAASSGNDLIA